VGSVLDKYVREQTTNRTKTVTGWYTVTINDCWRVSKCSITLALKYALMPLDVQLFDFKSIGDGSKAQFFVDNILMANRLRRLNGKVALLYSNRNIEFNVETGLPADLKQPTNVLLSAMKTALLARYDEHNKTLDLTRFHTAAELKDEFCPLHVLSMLEQLLQLISNELTELRVLRISDNYICSLSAFAKCQTLPALQLLDISANRLEQVEELKHLQRLKLVQLNIEHNPLAKQPIFQIREMLPQVQFIVGCVNKQEQDGQIKTQPLPKHKIRTVPSASHAFCISFIKFYYTLFEERAQRIKLKEYYDDNAMFSLSFKVVCHKKSDIKKLHVGLDNIVQTLNQLPDYKINVADLQLDVQCYDNQLRMFTVSGSCQESTNSGWHARDFVRTFRLRGQSLSPLPQPVCWLIEYDMLSFGLAEELPEIEATNSDLNEQMQQLSAKMPELMLEAKPVAMQQEQSNATSLLPSSFETMPPLVPVAQTTIGVQSILEREIQDTLLCSDDELLIINEEVLLEPDEL
ncbi:Nxf3, partial [Drosophila busckii]